MNQNATCTNLELGLQLNSRQNLLRVKWKISILNPSKISQILLPKLKQKLVFYQIKYSLQGDFSHIPQEIIDKLKSRSLLDATAFKEYLLRRYSKHPQAYLRHLFAKYQLDFPIDSKNDDQLKIRQLLTHKKYQSTNWSDRAVKTKIMASFFRKGFAYDDIKSVIDEIAQNR